jgi:hypothetical protein
MQTLHAHAIVGDDGKLRLEVPCNLPPGPTEVVVVVTPIVTRARHTWSSIRGLGREIWQDEEAQEYINRLRDE